MAKMQRRLVVSAVLCLCVGILGGCATSGSGGLKRDNSLEWTLNYLEKLLADGFRSEVLAEIRSILDRPGSVSAHPRLFLLTARVLFDFGYKDDARMALDLADKAVYAFDTSTRKKEFQDRLDAFKNRLGTLQVQPMPNQSAIGDTLLPIAEEKEPESAVTNSWFETGLTQVLTDISQETGIPILWDNTVQGLVTYEAKNAPLFKVLEDILFTNGYVSLFKNGTYYVGAADVKSPSFASLSQTYTFSLSNIMAQDAVQLLPEPFRAFVQGTNTSNAVCVTAPPSLARRIVADLKAIDAPMPQVEIEVAVVEFSVSDLKKIGINWDLGSLNWNNKEALYSIVSPEMQDAVLALDHFRSAVKIGGRAFDIAASVRALEDAGIAQIRALPRIRTINGRTALIETAKEQYFFITADDGGGGGGGQMYGWYNRLETIKSGIQLMITPYVDSSGSITVVVKPQVDDVVGQGANGLPEISRRSANTTVRVKNGETITIGGLRRVETKSIKKRVPFLGKIPILGYLFGYSEDQKIESELMIFITPYVLHDQTRSLSK